MAASKSRSASSLCSTSSSWPSSSCLRSSVFCRRSKSIARCLAVPINQAPGLAGMPDTGHCSSAATRASWASSSATPTSRTICARLAISRADSIRQTASIVRWVSDVSGLGGCPRLQAIVLLPQFGRVRLPEVVGLDHLSDLDLEWAQAPLEFRCLLAATGPRSPLEPFDRLFLRLHLPQPVAGDQFLGLGKRPVDYRRLPAGEPDPRAFRARVQAVGREHHASLDQLLVVLPHLLQKRLRGHDARLGFLVGFDQDHESHLKFLLSGLTVLLMRRLGAREIDTSRRRWRLRPGTAPCPLPPPRAAAYRGPRWRDPARSRRSG